MSGISDHLLDSGPINRDCNPVNSMMDGLLWWMGGGSIIHVIPMIIAGYYRRSNRALNTGNATTSNEDDILW